MSTPGTLMVRHHNITPAGDEALAVEFAYSRVDAAEQEGGARPPRQ